MANVVWTMAAGATRTAVGTCATGSDTFGAAATDGASLDSLSSFIVHIAADAGQTLSGAGTLECYLYNDVTGRWSRFKDLDLITTASAVRDSAFLGLSPGVGIPVITPRGRIGYRPNGVTVSAGGLTIYIVCVLDANWKAAPV